jgi:DNA invertase Pin-like site-specific DNA recombinase
LIRQDFSNILLKDLLHIMERIRDAGAGFRSLTEAVDTTTSAGRMVMQMLGSFAEFERSMVRERTRPAWRPRGIAA